MDQFLVDEVLPVMYDDGFAVSHPVLNNVDDPNEIMSLFDSITYSKGSALLFMLESTVGADNFQKGLHVINRL
jgi:aminopeptidase N